MAWVPDAQALKDYENVLNVILKCLTEGIEAYRETGESAKGGRCIKVIRQIMRIPDAQNLLAQITSQPYQMTNDLLLTSVSSIQSFMSYLKHRYETNGALPRVKRDTPVRGRTVEVMELASLREVIDLIQKLETYVNLMEQKIKQFNISNWDSIKLYQNCLQTLVTYYSQGMPLFKVEAENLEATEGDLNHSDYSFCTYGENKEKAALYRDKLSTVGAAQQTTFALSEGTRQTQSNIPAPTAAAAAATPKRWW